MLAEVFLYRGYGIGNAKTEVNFPMDSNSYYNYMRAILFKGFQKLEAIMVTECKLKAEQVDDLKSVRFKSELCKCERWMQRS